MKIDMSPQAVTARLKLLNHLWELTVKLLQVRQGKAREQESEQGSEKLPLTSGEGWGEGRS